MATAKEIKSKMGSVRSTQKITRAMELIAASKVRLAKQRMDRAKPYAECAREIIRHLARAHPEYHHPYLKPRPVNQVGMILVSSDRGLCGGLNLNLFRECVRALLRFQKMKIPVKVAVIGQKAQSFVRKCAVEVLAAKVHLGDKPGVMEVVGSVQVMLDAYAQETIDELYIFSNAFISTIKQKPYERKLLPIEPAEDLHLNYHWDYLYEPEAKPVLDQLFTRYIESQVYQAVVENIACEQAARMVAMKNATDNAGEVIKDLKLQYNKARQAAITKELAEIVSGAEAQNE